MIDIAIIGAGVIGAFCARELSRYRLNIAVLEQEEDVCGGASGANSGIVHAGFDALPQTRKSFFNVAGNRMMETVCAELGVPFRRTGSLVLAGAGEEERLRALLARGASNRVTGLRIIGREELAAMEPHLADRVQSALWAPTGGIVCPHLLTIAAMGNAMDNGVQLHCGFRVVSAEPVYGGWLLTAETGETVHARIVVNCAGTGAQKVAELFKDNSVRIGFRKGEYMLLDKEAGGFASHTLFTLPDQNGKGVLISPTADGNLLIGPTAVQQTQPDTAVRREAFSELTAKAGLLLCDIPFSAVITSFAGVRACSSGGDFIIGDGAVPGLYHVAGIESPGLTSAPAIGAQVAAVLAERLGAQANPDFNPHRRPAHWFQALSEDERNSIIRQNPAYGQMVCRCEQITVGEILDALHDNPPAHTLDGVKLRTRAGMGRCQGGFCQPTVFNMLMQTFGYRAQQVTKKGGGSCIITGGEL